MENENNVKNNVQTTPVDQAVVNNAPAQPQATNVVENNVVKEIMKNQIIIVKDSYCIPYVDSYCYFFNYCILCMVH